MSLVNVERILNDNPVKRLSIGFDKLKENYTESAAAEYLNLYKDMPVSFIVENSRMIFSEPYYGLDFYKNHVLEAAMIGTCVALPDEKEKVQNYLEENADVMDENQKQLYEDLITEMDHVMEEYAGTITVANYGNMKSGNSDFSKNISDALYEYVMSDDADERDKVLMKIDSLMESVTNPYTFYAYAPYVEATVNMPVTGRMFNDFYESETDDCDIAGRIITSVALSKLSGDKPYMEAVENIINSNVRRVITEYANTGISAFVNDITSDQVTKENAALVYVSPTDSINSIFAFEQTCENNIDELNGKKALVESYAEFLADEVSNLLLYECQTCDDLTRPVSGYDIFSEGTSIADAYAQCSEFYESEKSDTENTDNGKPLKKLKAQSSGNAVNKLQTTAQDIEAKQMKAFGKAKKAGRDVVNAGKAVTALPRNFMAELKNMVKIIDDKDEARRKKFLVEPGFRKKIFRNLKLAILYGSVAQTKLSLLPITWTLRHFSKERDQRIKNECIREIATNIKICDERINDANNSDNKEEKYRLMQVKSKLEAELERVKFNSRYV